MFSVVYVCRFVHSWGRGDPNVTITHDELDLTLRHFQTCSICTSLWNIFKPDQLDLTVHAPHSPKVGKRAVGILLECFLVFK